MYTTKDFNHLLGIKGLSDELFKNHLMLYEGYVKNVNKLNDILVTMEKRGEYETPQYAELNRRLGWEFNGMRLHELYFENLSKQKQAIDKNSKIYQALLKEFGSYEFFEKDFRALAAIRGIGWVVLYYDKAIGRLFNVWINEHDVGHLTGCIPLLVMDVFEHAYMLDYGLKKADYIETFFKIINWKETAKRFNEL